MIKFFPNLIALWTALFKDPWLSWIAYRHVRSKKNSRFLSFITVLSVTGIALGVASMLVVLSVMEGFEGQLKKRLMASDTHLLIEGSEMRVLEEKSEESALFNRLKHHPNVEFISPTLQTEVILKFQSAVTGLLIKGIKPDRLKRLERHLVDSIASQFLTDREGADLALLPHLFLGKELANELGVSPGDIVTAVSPAVMDGPAGQIPRMKRFVIAGVYSIGLPEQEIHIAYADINSISSLLRERGTVSHWEVILKNFDQADLLRDELKSIDPSYKIKSWSDMNAHLFYSLRLERIAMFIVLAFIIIVASFNIVTTLTLMVLKKQREISILIAMGAKPSQIGGIFLGEGLVIGVGGVIIGLLSGGVLCWVLSSFPIVELPPVYYDRRLPIAFEPGYYALVAFAALVIVLIACVYPAMRASRLSPMQGIRA